MFVFGPKFGLYKFFPEVQLRKYFFLLFAAATYTYTPQRLVVRKNTMFEWTLNHPWQIRNLAITTYYHWCSTGFCPGTPFYLYQFLSSDSYHSSFFINHFKSLCYKALSVFYWTIWQFCHKYLFHTHFCLKKTTLQPNLWERSLEDQIGILSDCCHKIYKISTNQFNFPGRYNQHQEDQNLCFNRAITISRLLKSSTTNLIVDVQFFFFFLPDFISNYGVHFLMPL